VTNCEWREKIGLYVDGELEPREEQSIASHLQSCAECSSAVLEQQALKKAVRVAGKRFTAPPELYASVQRQMRPEKSSGLSLKPWLKWSTIAASTFLLALVTFALLSRPSASNTTVAQLIDEHVIMLASANPVDVVSSDKHTVKPWLKTRHLRCSAAN
jgi:anti-sigma factor RsiW